MTHLSGSWSDMTWLNPPPKWYVADDGALTATSGDKTDFWQRTFYGFQRDDGHALLAAAQGDFTAAVTIHANYETLYYQCGLLLRISEERWIKFGVEYNHEGTQLSCVATDGRSDWSAATIKFEGPLSLRMNVFKDTIMCQWLDEGLDEGLREEAKEKTWRMARLLPRPGSASQTVSIGPYLCSPEREGFEAKFSGFELTDPKQTEL